MTYGAISVRVDGGALGDGSTDDTSAFQQCANTGGIILVPAGTYIVDHVDLPVSCEWVGEGAVSIIRKKANSVTSSYDDPETFLFNVTDADITVGFTGMTLDGNWPGQATTRAGATPANTNGTTNAYSGSATVMATGGVLTTANATPDTSAERLIVRFRDCLITRTTLVGIDFRGVVDVGAFAELTVDDCMFTQSAAGICSYDDGGDGLPVQGYSWSSLGATPEFISIQNAGRAKITGCTFLDTRNPTSGTTNDTGLNPYNYPPTAILCTTESPSDASPEWSELVITGNRFIGVGRPFLAGNRLGVIDLYVRGGNSVISDNVFATVWSSAIRGKCNAKNLTITGNTIEDVYQGGGVELTAPTYAPQRGGYVIANNSIKDVSQGIALAGDPAASGDADGRVNNLVISGNIIEDVANLELATAGLRSTYATQGYAIYARYLADLLITGNVIRNTDTATGSNGQERGIYIRDSKGAVSISGNNIADTAVEGIYVQQPVGRTSITDNQVDTTGADGIGVSTSTGPVIITGNQVTSVTGTGINVSNTGVNVISGNHVKTTTTGGIVAGSSVTTDIIATDNVVEGVSGNSASTIVGLDAGGAKSSGTITFRGNRISGVVNAGSGTALGIRAQFSSTAEASTLLLDGNRISGTDESAIWLQHCTGVIALNEITGCNTSGTTTHGAILINGIANSGILRMLGNTVSSDTNAFPTTGSVSLNGVRNGRLIHEVGNSWAPLTTVRSGVPTSGTWAVGDIVWDIAPTSGGTIGWVCVTAGSPGTWKAFGTIA